jgi:hypothetical protein
MTDDDVAEYFERYGAALSAFDPVGTTGLWGFPATMVTDDFVGSLATAEELAGALGQAQELYRQLGLDRADHQLMEVVRLTDALVRARVRWSFRAVDGSELMSSDYVYLLRSDPDGLRAYVAVSLDEAGKLAELAESRGVTLA